ncbi:hypothetical protein CANCADRAFT_1212 [Tortispora caseinolytica NRRL Y-17796]|uniref:Pyridoxamine kinase/Phosphomethylpyrimidine kinase domain-containing protein n=1 Tax=Tortispora caseinolytica NRRL Y-17796 TaxID=767744 RepID=A0A1E4TLI3_9ASCO|nr:hypothetical protein CANCADRAFT_1212 [Tortispora caseinolytica NRRL Y-17796]
MTVRARVLTIAGSDCSGGAGIEADLKTFTANGCYGMTCITALTAQNTTGVKSIFPVSDQQFISTALTAIESDIGIDAIKTGMLYSSTTISTVAKFLRSLKVLPPVVVDPVLVSTSGSQLLPDDAVRGYVTDLAPLARLMTPNLQEALRLAQELTLDTQAPQCLDDMKQLARDLANGLGCGILLKGGHLPLSSDYKATTNRADQQFIVDVLCVGNEIEVFEGVYTRTKNLHGTGCTLSAAIAANLAKGESMFVAVKDSIAYVQQAIAVDLQLGSGNGPIDHLVRTNYLPFARNKFVDYLIAHPKVKDKWHEFVHHPFVQQLANGTLDRRVFQYYLQQDYLYLVHYARASALASYKATDIDTIAKSAAIVLHIQQEMKVHEGYCRSFGLSVADMKAVPEDNVCTAYSRYLLDIGQTRDWFSLQVAMSPCLIGYYQIGQRLYNDPNTKREGNPYWGWIENYAAPDFVEAAELGIELLETHSQHLSPSKLQELVEVFAQATVLESRFWQMGFSHDLPE